MKDHLWIAKALAQAAVCRLGLLPLYHIGQRKIGRLKGFHPRSRIEYAAKLYSDVKGLQEIEGAIVVEVGTGWVPVVPLTLHMMGAARITTFDMSRHLQPGLTMACVPKLHECLDELHRRTWLDVTPLSRRLDRLCMAKDVHELFSMANIDYRAPADASRSGLPGRSVDIFYSNLVLEHVNEPALQAIHAESRRVLKPTGVVWHNVDFSDHYAATHRTLSTINFLRYSRSFWERFGNNAILYQNRMRRGDHLSLMQRCGLNVERCVDHASKDAEAALSGGLKIHNDYRGAPPLDVLTSSSRIVARNALISLL